MTQEEREQLTKQAIEARKRAYTPYSHFQVGAALRTKDGRVYTGCNIENAAFGPSNCAERTAFFCAVNDGAREFDAIAVVGGPEGAAPEALCPPCGVCRQVMAEFCRDDFEIILGTAAGAERHFTLKELLPLRFGPEHLA